MNTSNPPRRANATAGSNQADRRRVEMAEAKRICAVEGCEKPVLKRQWCSAHYHRWKRHGDPLAGRPAPYGEPLRWMRERLTYADDGCLTWPFGRYSTGYGVLCGGGKERQAAHRWVCAQVNGPPPSPEHHAAHSCGKGHEGCVAPLRLRWATPAENVADAIQHGTLAALGYQGERHPRAKLTMADVTDIRRRLRGGERMYELAREFGVSHASVSSIKTGRTWPEPKVAARDNSADA